MTDPTLQNQENASPWTSEDWLREFAEIFFLRIHIIIITGLLVLIGAVLVAYYWPPTYRAQAHILVRSRTPRVSTRLMENRQERYPLEEAHVTSELEILRSPRLIKQTIRELRQLEGLSALPENSEKLAQEVRGSRSQLDASVIPSSFVIRVSYTSKNPRHAERFVDHHLENYLTYRNQVFSTPEETEFLGDRAELYREKLQEVRQQIVNKTAEAGNVAPIDKELANNTDLQRELRRRLSNLRAEYASTKESIKPLREALKSDDIQYFAFLDNRSINRLGERLASLVEEREETAQEYQPGSRQMESINTMVDKTYKKLRAEARNIYQEKRQEVESSAAAISSLETSLRKLGERNVELNKRAVEIRRLQNRAEMLESSYRAYAEKREEAEINSAVTDAKISGDVSILNKAATSAEIAYPRPIPTLLIGFATAVIVGLTLAFITEYLDQSIHRASEVHRFLNLPVLCSIEDIE